MLDVRRLIMLRAVAAEGSIAAAARRLQYTRSAVSQQLSVLEAEAGTALIERTGNRITLTSAGRNLVEHAERIVVELRAAQASLDGATTITGLLRVGIPFREGPWVMSRGLTEVRRRFPDMEIRLAAVTDESAADAVRRDDLDIVIISRYGNARGPAGQGLREWIIGQDPLTLCVHPDHPLAGGGRCTMGRLEGEPWILPGPDTTLGRLITSMCVTAGFQPRVTATVNDVGTALALAGIGWGITIAPELTPSPAPVSRMRITGVDVVRYTVLIVRDGEHLSPRLAAAISAVRTLGATPPA
jgi:DNA-binding transcriptional LysR family regulator